MRDKKNSNTEDMAFWKREDFSQGRLLLLFFPHVSCLLSNKDNNDIKIMLKRKKCNVR